MNWEEGRKEEGRMNWEEGKREDEGRREGGGIG